MNLELNLQITSDEIGLEFLNLFHILRCGISVISTVIFEIPIFYFSSVLLERIGACHMMCLACMSYSARTAGYVLVHRMGINILLLDLLCTLSISWSSLYRRKDASWARS